MVRRYGVPIFRVNTVESESVWITMIHEMGRAKRKSDFEHAQNVRIHIILFMHAQSIIRACAYILKFPVTLLADSTSAGGGGGETYIWDSRDVRAEWSPFSALPGI